METDELKYWIAFNRVPRIGRARFMALERHFGTLEAAWRAGPHDLQAAGIDSRTALRIVSRRATLDPDAEIEQLQSVGTRALTWHDPEYPARLKEIYDLPPVLYVRGELAPEDERSIAVVGTRKPTVARPPTGFLTTWRGPGSPSSAGWPEA
jgi:DNA processing protein